MRQRDLREVVAEAGRVVPALQPRPGVVVPVGVVAVEDQVAGELDLVRRVVGEVPGLGRVPQTDLQQRGRHGQQGDHGDGERRGGPARPRHEPPRRRGREGDEHAGEERGRADHAEIPLAVGRPHQRAERALRIDALRPERPRLRAELGHEHEHQRAEHAQQREGLAPAQEAGTSSRCGAVVGAGAVDGSVIASRLAARARSSHVIGSSKKPL
jgi:hypothetical protein